MENQLSFFVLQKIYDLVTVGITVAEPRSLIEKIDTAIKKLLQYYPLITRELSFHHLLHCCHLKFRPAMSNSSSSKSLLTDELEQKWRGAMDIYKAGIKFKPILPNRSNELSLLDVQLISGRALMIPTLIIEDRAYVRMPLCSSRRELSRTASGQIKKSQISSTTSLKESALMLAANI